MTKSGGSHTELDNEPSIASPWLYDFAGAPWHTQEIVRAAMKQIWINAPNGISGNDDLGEMSSWYVWAALGMYPLYPGRAEFVLGSPLFDSAVIDRPGGRVVIDAKGAGTEAPYVTALSLDGKPVTQAWLPASIRAKRRDAGLYLVENAGKDLGRRSGRYTAVFRAVGGKMRERVRFVAGCD